MTWLHTWPLPMIGVAVFVMLIASAEIGYGGAVWIMKLRKVASATDTASSSGGRDYLLTAMLALMALLLGFTFSLALSRFEARRDLVVKEADALRSAWMHAQLLRAPDREAVSSLLRSYVEARVHWSVTYSGSQEAAVFRQVQPHLWEAVGAAAREEPSGAIGGGLMQAVSNAFDVAADRVAARSASIPDRVLNTLVLYIVLAVVMLGEVSATRDGLHRISTWLLLVLLTLALLIILDLDRASDGAIMVSQQPLLDLLTSIR